MSKRAFSKRERIEKMSEAPLSIGRQRVGALKKTARVEKNASLNIRIRVECGNRLRVEVRAKNASLSGFACRPF